MSYFYGKVGVACSYFTALLCLCVCGFLCVRLRLCISLYSANDGQFTWPLGRSVVNKDLV